MWARKNGRREGEGEKLWGRLGDWRKYDGGRRGRKEFWEKESFMGVEQKQTEKVETQKAD